MLHLQPDMDHPPTTTAHQATSLSSSGIPGPSVTAAAAGTGPPPLPQLHLLPQMMVWDLTHE